MTDNQQMTQQFNPTEQQHFVRAVYAEVTQMIKNGQSTFRIQQSLVERGLQLEDAREIVTQMQEAQDKAHRNDATKQMIIGATLFFTGIALALGIYASASNVSLYIIAATIIVFGGWQFIRARS